MSIPIKDSLQPKSAATQVIEFLTIVFVSSVMSGAIVAFVANQHFQKLREDAQRIISEAKSICSSCEDLPSYREPKIVPFNSKR